MGLLLSELICHCFSSPSVVIPVLFSQSLEQFPDLNGPLARPPIRSHLVSCSTTNPPAQLRIPNPATARPPFQTSIMMHSGPTPATAVGRLPRVANKFAAKHNQTAQQEMDDRAVFGPPLDQPEHEQARQVDPSAPRHSPGKTSPTPATAIPVAGSALVLRLHPKRPRKLLLSSEDPF